MSFVSQVMSPGGGVMLLPFVRLVIGCLILLTMSAFVAGVARIHMAILTVLSGGLLFSLSFFESEFNKAKARGGNSGEDPSTTKPATTANNTTSSSTTTKKQVAKTD
jgi:hypothetical protein